MTRGENIRQAIQTDEGLADFMFEHNISDEIAFCKDNLECGELMDNYDKPVPEGWCKRCLVKWLKEEDES